MRLLLGGLVAAGLGAAALFAITGHRGSTAPAAVTSTVGTTQAASLATASRPTGPVRLVERRTGSLPAPLQDPSAAAVGGSMVLAGGLTAADTSTAEILRATASGAHVIGALPTARHDTAAAAIGPAVYVFGGGNGVAQLDDIVRVDPATGRSTLVGHLPAASSDSSAAAIGGTAYVVGGYTGTRWLDTIVAWRPGSAARVVAHLPHAVRYAAVAAASGRLIVAGGSLEDGTASSSVYEFAPASGRVVRIGSLPRPTTHAAAAAIGPFVYVVGGRSATLNTPIASIVAIDPLARRIVSAGRLTSPRSDLAAVALGGRILVAGGHGPGGTETTIGVLAPAQRKVSSGSAPAVTTKAAPAKPASGNVYGADGPNMLTGAARSAKSLVYVPNSQSDTVDVIDPRTYTVIRHFAVGGLPQHVVPAWNLRTLYVTNDTGNSLTAIDPRTGRPGRTIPVTDPYNMYFTPNGRYAIVVAERLHQLDFRNARTFRLSHTLVVPCTGVDHMDFSADGRYLLASCEFSGQLVKVDVASQRVVGVLDLPGGASMPQDVKLSADGRIFYVADMHANGVWKVSAARLRVLGFLPTGAGAHGLYPSRDAKLLYVTNRSAGSISVVSFRTGRVVTTWHIPGGGSPDMGGVSADGKVLWVSGRYSGVVYALSTRNGRLLARIPVGAGPHGLCVWPQPGRYSLGHTGILR